jgi:hypothetical protein
MALIYRETKHEKNSKTKGAVFLEKEKPSSSTTGKSRVKKPVCKKSAKC